MQQARMMLLGGRCVLGKGQDGSIDAQRGYPYAKIAHSKYKNKNKKNRLPSSLIRFVQLYCKIKCEYGLFFGFMNKFKHGVKMPFALFFWSFPTSLICLSPSPCAFNTEMFPSKGKTDLRCFHCFKRSFRCES